MHAETRAVIEVLHEAMIEQQAVAQQAPASNTHVMEAFSRINALLAREDQGWEVLIGGPAEQYEGLKLADLKGWGKKIYEAVVGAPWIGQGFRLRHSYVWKDGIRYGNLPEPTRGKTNIKNLTLDTQNVLHFFGDEARRRRELSLYSEGIALWIGNDDTKKLESVPLSQIKDQILDPNGLGFVWAYKREWTERNLQTGDTEDKKRWYFTDRFFDKKVESIREVAEGGEANEVEVSQNERIFDQHANSMPGMPYGSPDALAAYLWNDVARGAYMDGVAMVKALASFALKASVKSNTGGNNAALRLANGQGAAQTAVLGGANDLVPMASAGKGYEFDGLRAITAIIATSLSVSNIALTSDTANAGSSYGAAEVLDLPVRLAMEARRAEHIALDRRVLQWMGLDDPEIAFVPFMGGEETYRASQSLLLEYAADIYDRQELRDFVDDLHSRPNGTVPSEDKRPSVLAAKALAKAVPKPEPVAAPAPGDDAGKTPKQAASPAQGKSNGTGGQQGGNSSNDIRRK